MYIYTCMYIYAKEYYSAIKNHTKVHLQQHRSPRDYRSKLSKSDIERCMYHFLRGILKKILQINLLTKQTHRHGGGGKLTVTKGEKGARRLSEECRIDRQTPLYTK